MKEYIKEAKLVERNVLPYYYDLEVDYKDYYREEGREEGREEEKNKVQLEKMSIVKGMLNDGIPFEKIKKYFKLTDNELQNINN